MPQENDRQGARRLKGRMQPVRGYRLDVRIFRKKRLEGARFDRLMARHCVQNGKPVAKTLPQEPVDGRAGILVDMAMHQNAPDRPNSQSNQAVVDYTAGRNTAFIPGVSRPEKMEQSDDG
jgi:hypothetical protein